MVATMNIGFVYALLASEPLKKQIAVQLLEQALGSRKGCTSYQVIQEFAKRRRLLVLNTGSANVSAFEINAKMSK